MTEIKKIEIKEEWLKLIIDGAKGVSDHSDENNYIFWNGKNFMYSLVGSVSIEVHTKDFGIIEEVEEIELFEYMYKHKGKFKTWHTYNGLYTEKEAEVEFKDYEYRKTGRSFKVPKD
jgi:hypothetical protein